MGRVKGGKLRIAIIGGSGLIGQALSKELNENGHQVTILSRKANPEQTTNSVQWRQWDGKEAGNLAKILADDLSDTFNINTQIMSDDININNSFG